MQRSAGIGIYRCFLFLVAVAGSIITRYPESPTGLGVKRKYHIRRIPVSQHGKQLSAAGRGSRLGGRSGSINYQFGSLLVSK